VHELPNLDTDDIESNDASATVTQPQLPRSTTVAPLDGSRGHIPKLLHMAIALEECYLRKYSGIVQFGRVSRSLDPHY
jgi:hypothetical protein